MSKIIGVTGPTGSGKSLMSVIADRMGIFVINCDASARKAAYRGSALVRDLADNFGEDILDEDGELNRKALAEKAFANERSTMLLNRVSLPSIGKFVKGEIRAAEDEYDVILLDAPTLFESGLDAVCDAVIAVLADTKVRKERITERDSITIEEAELRIGAGKDEEFYTSKTPYVIYNNADQDSFQENAIKLLKKLTGGNRK